MFLLRLLYRYAAKWSKRPPSFNISATIPSFKRSTCTFIYQVAKVCQKYVYILKSDLQRQSKAEIHNYRNMCKVGHLEFQLYIMIFDIRWRVTSVIGPPPVQIALWAHMHNFLSVRPSIPILDHNCWKVRNLKLRTQIMYILMWTRFPTKLCRATSFPLLTV